MAETQEPARNPNTDYERSDLSLKAVGVAALIVLALLAIGPLALHEFDTSVPDDVSRAPAIVPPAPQLQTDAPKDLHTFLAAADQKLNSYGWVDRARGIVHIPIEEAMKRLAAQGIDGFPRNAP
jgi:hypothetical protein